MGVRFLLEGFAGADACSLQLDVSDTDRGVAGLVEKSLFEEMWVEEWEAREGHLHVVVK